jgi:hypothetical protein
MKSLKKQLSRQWYRFKVSASHLVFPLNHSGKALKSFKNTHTGKRCFIIGNGPSLKAEDLEQLKNEITFAFNRIYLIFDQTSWRPSYYCAEDNKIIFKSKVEIDELALDYKFFPLNFPRDYYIKFKNAIYYIFKFGPKNEEPQFSKDIVEGIYWGNTVVYTAIQMAVYMGLREIYLIGVDHNFSKMIDDQGNIVHNPGVKDYYCDEYNLDKEDLYIPSTEMSTKAFQAAKKYADQNNINIYNATRGGKLEVFPRVDFNQIKF